MLADAQKMLQHHTRLFRRLDGLRQDHEIENLAGIFDQVGVGVALHHRQAARHAGIDVLLRQFDAAPVDAFCPHQMFQQRAVAAADVQHPRAGRDHVGDGGEIGT
jgi:hypothetical protein